MVELNYTGNNEYYICPKCGRIIKRQWEIKENILYKNPLSSIEVVDQFKSTDLKIDYQRPSITCTHCDTPYIAVKNELYATFAEIFVTNGIEISSYYDDMTSEYLSCIAFEDVIPFFSDNVLPPTHNFILIKSRTLIKFLYKIQDVCATTPIYSNFLYTQTHNLKPCVPGILVYLDDRINLGEETDKLKLSDMDRIRREVFEQDIGVLITGLSKV